jgi:hypothetical protein
VSGDLVVLLKPGWAAGRTPPDPNAVKDNAGASGGPDITNPYNGSDGGPRNRAVAALINGPTSGCGGSNAKSYCVRQVDAAANGGWYPVLKSDRDPRVNPSKAEKPPPPNPSSGEMQYSNTQTDPGGVNAANDPNPATNPNFADDAFVPPANYPDSLAGEDPKAYGHEVQPVTVDFAPTIAALLQVSMPADQIQGRIVQEAFTGQVTPVCDTCEDIGVGELPIEEPAPPPPPPPKQPKGFDFNGLVRELRAQVVDDKAGSPYKQAKPGASMSTVKLEGDFGKPKSSVTLTFYRQVVGGAKGAKAKKRAKGKVVRVKAIARFDPFPLTRGHVVMRLKVPGIFHPSHIGVSVQQITDAKATGGKNQPKPVSCTTVKPLQPVKFMCFGPTAGDIVGITDASKLHTRKPAPRGRSRRVFGERPSPQDKVRFNNHVLRVGREGGGGPCRDAPEP